VRIKLPSFLRHQEAVRAFERQEPGYRKLVFYSEGQADWPHLGPVVRELLNRASTRLSYLSSDESDPGLAIEDERVRSFHVGDGTARTILFARMQCDAFVMTLPDLGNMWLKRSVHPVRYVYLFHSMNSTHTSYRPGAFDNFDTVLCVGPHHVDEIRRTEAEYGLPAKELVEHGSSRMDDLMELAAGEPRMGLESGASVLVAPTWGDSSMLESPLGEGVIAALLNAGHRTVVRPHPMTTRRLPDVIKKLERSFRSNRRFSIDLAASAADAWADSHVMVSDWSGAASEYALALLKPVIFVDTAPKIMNPDWARIGIPSFESQVRDQVGHVIATAEVGRIGDVVRQLTAQPRRQELLKARDRLVFNVGFSARVAADYLGTFTATT
jgi:hypothetical protein